MKTNKQVTQDRIKLIQENPDKTVAEIAKMADCCDNTIYRLKRELKRNGVKLPALSRGRKPKEKQDSEKRPLGECPWPKGEAESLTDIQIKRKCGELQEILVSKNQNYGNSALTAPPLADVSIQTGILVRLGDKFKRLQQLTHGEQDKVGESLKDTIQDIAGYCILYLVSEAE